MKEFGGFSNKFSYDTYKQKYSLDGQEEWSDTCKRVVSSVCGQLLNKADQEEIFKIMESREFIPGGRYLYSSGRPFHQVNNCHDGKTEIITETGVKTLESMLDKQFNVLNRFGKWEKATVKKFGVQPLQKITFQDGREVLATENHRWWQEDGSRVTTKELKEVPVAPAAPVFDVCAEGIRNGIIFGDGQLDFKTKEFSYVILIGKKEELHSYFSDEPIKRKGRYDNIRIFPPKKRIKAGLKISLQNKHYKELPNVEICSPSYARGFIAGLIATDGSTKTTSVTISCEGYELAQKIAKLAVLGGCRVKHVKVIDRINPFTGAVRELSQVTLENQTAPLIREDQKTTVNSRVNPLKVLDISYSGKTEETYCVVAPESESFTLANGLITSNCFLFRAEDSREGWADLMQKSTLSLMTGGGIGIDYSKVREEGAIIHRTGGKSTGPLSLMHMVNESGRYIMQGGQRRSAIWAGLSWKHADVFKFLNLKNHSPELRALKAKDFNFQLSMELTNVSVIYDTEFFIAISDTTHEKHEHANKVWKLNCSQAFSTAEPGFAFNFRKDNDSLRNACVTGDTEILTEEGYQRIDSLVDTETNVWNGFEWSKVTPKITGKNQQLVKITTSDGRTLTCTEYHKFHIATNYHGETKTLNATELEPGMKLIKHDFPIIEQGEVLEDAYTQGFVSAEGMELNRTVYVYPPKKMCLDRLENIKMQTWEENNNRFRVTLKKVPVSKNFVPLNYNIKSKLDWLSGLFDGDGCELKEGGLQLGSVNRKFLADLQQMLSTLGIQSKVVPANAAGYRNLPDNKGFGDHKSFYCQESFRICIGAKQMQQLKKLGLSCQRLSFNKEPNRDASQFVTIVDVTEAGTAETVYCFNEPKRHLGIFNGILTGQCTEVTSEDDSDKCNLGTVWINRIKTVKRLRHVVKYSTIFLMCGGLYSDVPSEKIKEVGNKNNRIGLGLGGIHEWLMLRGEGYVVTPELHKWLSIYEEESNSTSFIKAKELNVAVPKGVRAIAPTGTIGIIAETTTGIEPLFCSAYKRRYYKDGNWFYQHVIDGSVKRLLDAGVPIEKIKDSYDIPFKQRVKFQADVQNYVDMAISSTCNMPSWGSSLNNEQTLEEYSAILLKYARRLRGFTCYPDGCRDGQPLTKIDLKEALEKEGVVFQETERECLNGVCGL